MTRKQLRSDIAWSDADHIVVRGHNLMELIGTTSLGDFAFLELTGRLATPQESTVFNAIVVVLVEHGLTPSAIAARLTHLGSPEALQASVAAGLLGIGDRFGGPAEEAARMLQEAFATGADSDVQVLSREIVRSKQDLKRPLPALGHPIPKPIDPRTPRLLEIAPANSFSSRFAELIRAISSPATNPPKPPPPLNATRAT